MKLNAILRPSRPDSGTHFPVVMLLMFASAFAHNTALAQRTITYTDLHPLGCEYSYALAVNGSQQVGVARINGTHHAALWSGTASSFVDLHPGIASWSEAWATSRQHQVGFIEINSIHHAALWSGTAGSFVDLSPIGSIFSEACGASGAQQVGWFQVSGEYSPRAALWSGTAASVVRLHPQGTDGSACDATNGSSQGGHVYYEGAGYHAGVWWGTAASFVDLDPGGVQLSWVCGVSGEYQAGYVRVGPPGQPGPLHAAVWRGTAESFVDLNPPGAEGSAASAASGPYQAGMAFVGNMGTTHAVLWHGTAESFLDLHAALGANFPYSSSAADGLWADGNITYVCGRARAVDGNEHALLWTVRSGPALQPQLQITAVPPDRIHITAEKLSAGASATFELSTDLIHWADLSTMVATNGTVELIEKNAGFSGARFYRLHVGQ